ncbi:MAG: hypothetical protein QW279_01200 [Candidatus Jordarchaeaceae archaeon]
MKVLKTAILMLTLILLPSMLLATASAGCYLPPPPVTMSVGPWPPLPTTITLTDFGSGYDVQSGVPYTGYCIELGIPVATPTQVTLVCTDSAGSPWNEINWLLNNYDDSMDLQFAIWRLQGWTAAEINYWMSTNPAWPSYSTTAENMYTEALSYSDFDPGPGDWVGVRCVGPEAAQDFLIKIRIPCYCYETAYGKGTGDAAPTDFIPTFSNWGWTNRLPGYGDYTFDLWAGAGQCDTSKGTWVGTVTIHYTSAGLTWDTDLAPGVVLQEEHVYAGTTEFPLVKQGKKTVPTVAPGKYTIASSLSGGIWVIYHAVVGIPC